MRWYNEEREREMGKTGEEGKRGVGMTQEEADVGRERENCERVLCFHHYNYGSL